MTIIPNIYDKIGVVLAELRPEVGASTFEASTVYDRYALHFPRDIDVMKQRRDEFPRAHSLRGYLDGMLYGYAQLTGGRGRDRTRPAIKFVSKMRYRFVTPK